MTKQYKYICVQTSLKKDEAEELAETLFVKGYTNISVCLEKNLYDVHILPGTRNDLSDLIEDVIADGYYDATLVE